MERPAPSRIDQMDVAQLSPNGGEFRLPLGVAALLIALLSGGMWIGFIWLLSRLM